MIFISGIHGVGKTFFCNMIKKELNIQSYSASQLIATRRNKVFSADKLVQDMDDNQPWLIAAVDELRKTGEEFILDGHFCLLNAGGEITRISAETYISLKPDMIVLLMEQPEIIAKRRFQRDGVHQDVSYIKAFQEAEKKYAEEISEQLGIPLIISHGTVELKRIVEIIREGELH